MTALKRWYRLSMLQILVAMAVGVFIYKNVETHTYTGGQGDLSRTILVAGWPFQYYMYMSLGERELQSGQKDSRMFFWSGLLNNLALVSALVIVPLQLNGLVRRRRSKSTASSI